MHELDVKNKKCPLPIIEISKKFKVLASGETLVVMATDPVFEADVKAWCSKTGNSLIEYEEKDGIKKATLKKS